tara:strand:+ start:1202 stop:1891 length:690 start_codon:yes stop_codon:yes gene_type:complete
MNKFEGLSFSSKFTNPNISASFSNKFLKSSLNDKRESFALQSSFVNRSLIIPVQTHSKRVVFSNESGEIKNCDGSFSTNENLVCTIQVADCLPIYFAHKFKNVFGLIHAGWRGLVDQIIMSTGQLLLSNKYKLEEFEVLIGPSIQSCCFEVQSDVVSLFDVKFVEKKINKSFKVDLQHNAKSDLCVAGFLEKNIEVVSICTFCNSDTYFSYRKDNKISGRMFGLIGLNI